jgi:anthranilate synthase/indole-3-glycerol phosphate synthase/phosphoribosylanthranilate isomerase
MISMYTLLLLILPLSSSLLPPPSPLLSSARPSPSSLSSSPTSHFFGIDDPSHTPSVLQSITAQREVDTTAAMEATSEAELRGRISAIRAELGPPLDLLSKIRAAHPAMALAAEFKRASPSKGVIAGGLGAAEQTVRYFGAGASVISTLTEERNFQGTLADLEAVRRATQAAAGGAPRPAVLRKDFITSRFMILEAAAAGADTVLLIVAVTPSDVLKDLIAFSRELGMEPLVEVHADEELPVALEAGARVLGVNNRNLHNFKMDLATTEVRAGRIASERSAGFTAVSRGDSLTPPCDRR